MRVGNRSNHPRCPNSRFGWVQPQFDLEHRRRREPPTDRQWNLTERLVALDVDPESVEHRGVSD
jgi:hypothetical protein